MMLIYVNNATTFLRGFEAEETVDVMRRCTPAIACSFPPKWDLGEIIDMRSEAFLMWLFEVQQMQVQVVGG